MQRLAVGIDIGGTKIGAALVDEAGEVHSQATVATPRSGYVEVLSAAGELVKTLSERADRPLAAIGVGSPGVVDPVEGVVRSATGILPGWAGAPVGSILRSASGLPVAVENDVRAMAFAEARLGTGRKYRTVLYVSIGTGVGGAVTRNGSLVRGRAGTVGEIAHLLVPATGVISCGCGRHDHLEAVAAGPAIAASYQARSQEDPIPLTEVGERLAGGDSVARQVVAEAAVLLGRALSGLVIAAGFDAVVVGGGVTALGDALMIPLREALVAEMERSVRCSVPVHSAELGPQGPMIGAALISLDAPSAQDSAKVAQDAGAWQ